MKKDKEKEFEEKMARKWEKKIEDKFDKWDPGKCDKKWHKNNGAMGGGFYFLTFIGAAIYFIGQATTFWVGVLGILKAAVWPAIVIYEVLKLLNLS